MKKKIILFIILLSLISMSVIVLYDKSETTLESFEKNNKKNNRSLTIMLENDNGNYEMSTSSNWPTEGYEFNMELSKCENGGELSWDEENKIVLLSGNTMDKCYIYFDKKTLKFYINDIFFKADPNMTWEEWMNSSYSNNFKSDNYLYTSEELASIGNFSYGNFEDTENYLYFDGNTHDGKNVSEYFLLRTFNDCSGLSDILLVRKQQLARASKIQDTFSSVENEVVAAQFHPDDIGDSKFYSCRYISVCLSPETLIDVEEIDEKGKKKRKRKKLKDIRIGDKVICINPFTLELDTDTVVECDGEMNKKHTCYDNWYFSDGTVITTIHRHRFYNVENKKFMYMDDWNIGEHGLNINNEKIELIKHEHIEEEINHCTLFTEKYNNYFANGLLSGNRKSKNIRL